MDPDGTVYLLINFIISVVLCLYIAALQRDEDNGDNTIGIAPSIVSAIVLFIVNLGFAAYYALPKFSLPWKCVLGALFVFLGVFLPYCTGLAKHEKLNGLRIIMKPVTTVLNCTVTFIITLPIKAVFKIFKLNTETEVTQEDVMELVEDASDDIIDDDQKEMIENIFQFGDLTAGEIMTHRTEVFAVNGESSCADVIQEIKAEGFSRIPVYSDTIDTVTGILFVKDLLGVIGNEEKLNLPVNSIARKAMFVPKSCPADELLVQFKSKRIQMAIVVDEYGGTSGIVTMEDILEEIVGNIQDEYDNEEEEFHKIDENTIICNASYDIEDAMELFGYDEELAEIADADYDTVGRLIMNKLARIPEEGEKAVVEYLGIRFTVLEVADRRIIKVKAERLLQQETEE